MFTFLLFYKRIVVLLYDLDLVFFHLLSPLKFCSHYNTAVEHNMHFYPHFMLVGFVVWGKNYRKWSGVEWSGMERNGVMDCRVE